MICRICKMYFKPNVLDQKPHTITCPKSNYHIRTHPSGTQHSYFKSVQTPQPMCLMALTGGWDLASVRALFNWAGNGCLPNQSLASQEIPILWTGFMVSFQRGEEVKAKWTKFKSIKKSQLWSPFSSGNWECLWNSLAWEVISLKHKDFPECVKVFGPLRSLRFQV